MTSKKRLSIKNPSSSREKLLRLRHDFYTDEPVDYDSINYFTSIEYDLRRLEKLDRVITLLDKHYVVTPNMFEGSFDKDDNEPLYFNGKRISVEDAELIMEVLEVE